MNHMRRDGNCGQGEIMGLCCEDSRKTGHALQKGGMQGPCPAPFSSSFFFLVCEEMIAGAPAVTLYPLSLHAEMAHENQMTKPRAPESS